MKVIGKADIAQALGLSRAYFFRKLHRNLAVLKKLEKVGYNKHVRTLTPKMVKIVYEYYGYPDFIDKD